MHVSCCHGLYQGDFLKILVSVGNPSHSDPVLTPVEIQDISALVLSLKVRAALLNSVAPKSDLDLL